MNPLIILVIAVALLLILVWDNRHHPHLWNPFRREDDD